MLVFCRTIMLNVFIKRFYVNLKEDFIREVRFLDVIKKDTVLFFDMDGTLTPSKGKMDAEMVELFKKLL